MLDFQALPTVSENDFADKFDEILSSIDNDGGPFLILGNNGKNLLLFGWEDYWLRFGCLYPDGEKKRIEEECSRRCET